MRDFLTLDAKSVRKVDENGFLHVAVSPLTKEQVAPYYGREIPGWERLGLDPSRTYFGYRPAEELSKPETVESTNGIPIHFRHHPDYADSPAKSTRVGATGTDGEWRPPYLMNSLHILDKTAQDVINNNSMRELSLAYRYDPDMTSGTTPSGEKFDFVMRNIRANHVALVEEGRAGQDVLVLDSAFVKPSNKDKTMEDNDKVNGIFADDPADKDKGEGLPGPVDKSEDPDVPAEDEDKSSALDDVMSTLVTMGFPKEKLEDIRPMLVELAAPAKAPEAKPEAKPDVKPEEVAPKPAPAPMPEPMPKGPAPAPMPAPMPKAPAPAQKPAPTPAQKPAPMPAPKPAEDEDEFDGEDAASDFEDRALRACGLDGEPEEIKRAFIAGLNFGDDDEEAFDEAPEMLDDEDDVPAVKAAEESDGEDIEERDRDLGQDAAFRRYRKAVCEEMQAYQDVRPVLGDLRYGAFDSAGDVYVAALKRLGMPGANPATARDAFHSFMAGRRQGEYKAEKRLGMDSKPAESGLDTYFNNVFKD